MSPERTDPQPFGTTVASEFDDRSRTTSSAGEETKEKVRGLGATAAEKARSMANQQKSRATSELHAIATALQQAARQLNGEGHAVGRLLETAGERLDRFTSDIESRDLIDDARSWSHRNPGVLVGSAAALGFMASRFMKASPDKAPPRQQPLGTMDAESMEQPHEPSRFEENALLFGAAGILIGAAIGALIPETRREHAMFGETRERVMSQAASTARQKAEEAKNVARDAALAAIQKAKSEVTGSDRKSEKEAPPFV